MTCTKFQNGLATEINFMDEWNVGRFELKMSFETLYWNILWQICMFCSYGFHVLVFCFIWWVALYIIIIPPTSTKLKGGYTGNTLSVCPSVCPSVRPSVRLSVCGQNRVRSVSSTILIGSISYLHILSSNQRRCVTCNASFKILKFWRIF